MAKLPLLILIVSTIFLLIGICISRPYQRDIPAESSDCDKNVPHVVITNATSKAIIRCHKCTQGCPEGQGLFMPCNGQDVSTSELNLECVRCVAGVNYSSEHTVSQCKPCLPQKCLDGEKMEGACEPTGDKRTCIKCELENWYYNSTQKICQPCDCRNVTANMKRICSGLGVHLQCEVPTTPVLKNPTSFSSNDGKSNSWKTMYTIIISVVVLVLLILYLCCVGRRVKILKLDHPQLSICSKEWFCSIFVFKAATRSRPPSYTPTDVHAPNGNGCSGRGPFVRQISCPVTQNEKYNVNNSPYGGQTFLRASLNQGDSQENIKLLSKTVECEQKKLKFFDMNSETCRKILQALKQNIETGMGYPTLAGLMGFSANKVKEFEEDGKPCHNMLQCWSNLNTKENNVLKLISLVVELKRDDIVQMLESRLQEAQKRCHCPNCVSRNKVCQGQNHC